MATYSTLLSNVLTLCDCVGDTGASNVAKIALELTMRLVSSRVYLRGLVGSATYIVVDPDLSVAIGVGGFGITDYSTPNRLYVNAIPYDFREYLDWLDLKSVPNGVRLFITEANTYDARPSRAWTIDDTNSIIADPLSVGDVLTFKYNKQPAAYADAGTPELPVEFDTILVSAASNVVKEYLKDPDQIANIYDLIASPSVIAQIEELDNKQNSNRKRRRLRMARSYSAPKPWL